MVSTPSVTVREIVRDGPHRLIGLVDAHGVNPAGESWTMPVTELFWAWQAARYQHIEALARSRSPSGARVRCRTGAAHPLDLRRDRFQPQGHGRLPRPRHALGASVGSEAGGQQAPYPSGRGLVAGRREGEGVASRDAEGFAREGQVGAARLLDEEQARRVVPGRLP